MSNGRIHHPLAQISAAAAGSASLVALLVATSLGGAQAGELPVTRVVLSSSGLAQFTHAGAVDGGQTVDLPVRLDQVDDVLKSLTVFDRDGGAGAASLPGLAPLDELFRDLPFDRDALASPVALVNALVGAEVEIAGPVSARGRILKVVAEEVTLPDGRGIVTRNRLTLVTDKGLVQAVVEDLASLTFTDAKARAEIDRALAGLAENRAKDRRRLTLTVPGQGRHDLSVAYVIAAPIWKTSWRMVLPKDGGKARLQGWAVLENLTGGDWKDIELTLVSGNPVALTQPLYTAVYGSRTTVPVSGGPRLAPRTDTEQAREMLAAGAAEGSAKRAPMPAKAMAMRAAMAGARAGEAEDAAPAFAPPPPAPAPMAAPSAGQAAEAQEAATQLAFRFPGKVSLATGHSMMVPFVDRDIAAERVWLYQPETDAHRPLAALKLTNDGETALPPGIVTAFETGASGQIDHVGDATLALVPRAASRLLSFALDSKTEVRREDGGVRRTVIGTALDGRLTTTTRSRRVVAWEITPPADEARQMILEEMRPDGWTVAAAAGEVELTASRVRRLASVPAGKTTRVELAFERTDTSTVDLRALPPREMLVRIQGLENAEPALKQAVERLRGLFADISKAEATRERNQRDRDRIYADQSRLRDNLQSVGPTSDLGKRYVEQMKAQENRLTELANSDTAADETIAARRKSAEEAVTQLKL